MKKGELKHVEKAGMNPPPVGKKRPSLPKGQGVGVLCERGRIRWIPVEERTPPQNEEVWVHDAEEEGVTIGFYHSRYGWQDIYGENDGLRDNRLYDVTHWQLMNRPEAPGEEKR